MGGAELSARLEQGMGGVKPSARLEQGMGGAEPSARLKERMGGAEPSARSDDMMREKTKKQKCGASKGKGNAPAVGNTKVPTKRKVGVAKRRRCPGQATLAEIRHLQRSVNLCSPFTPFLRLVREIVNKDVAPGSGIRFELVGMRALLEVAEAYLVHLMENTNELAIHAKRVTINVKNMRLADALWKPRWTVFLKGVQDEKRAEEERARKREERAEEESKGNASKRTHNKQRRTSSMFLSPEEVQSALSQVMKYATRGVHYDSNMELEMLKERVSVYFNVKLDIHRTIAANGDKATTALHLLDRLKRTRAAHSGSQTEESAYSLNGVVDWMCEDTDIDKSMQQKEGVYGTSEFKKLMKFQSRRVGMVQGGTEDDMKLNGAEIISLIRIKDIPQATPKDFHDLPTIVADGVEYFLLDQMVDFMKKSSEDKSVIHEVLHDVTEQTIEGHDVVEYSKDNEEDELVMGTPLCEGTIMAAL
ncbi:hypothetical protein CBR_g34602 [Chara braunii]|uniref:Core Histone H2A/H2B/H3 domain-containing protein n=1 Tax=Chara braunii TaxID=69332 RepID=A0A388LJ27_CHABU|nr:hypothetical protein CBR_g34602 [Chara braunii]|eukprot:GBG82318.1 hypothetical protein CBR_g34602 [Chara braunii]